MDRFATGSEPEIGEWLDSLALMATYARYFSSEEIQIIVGNWQTVRAEWASLLDQVRQMMGRGVPATDLQVQPLAQHWMGLIHQWLGGDFDLIERWGRVYQDEPVAHGAHRPEPALLRYIEQAITLRLDAWRRHFSMAEMSRFRRVDLAQWQSLTQAVEALMRAQVPPASAPARALADRLETLIRHVVDDDPVLLHQMRTAMAAEPLLRAGALLPAPVRAYLEEAASPRKP